LRSTYVQRPKRDYVMQWNLNLQQQLTPTLAAMVAYVGSRGVHQPFRVDEANLVIPTKGPNGYLWPKVDVFGNIYSPVCNATDPNGPPDTDPSCLPPNPINPAFGSVRGMFYEGHSYYNALEAQLAKRMSHGFQAQGTFTWAKSMDTSSASVAGDTFGNSISSLSWFDLRLSRGLAVLLFKDFNENFAVVNDFGSPEPLPTFDEVNAAGTRNNPDFRAAQAALQQATQEVTSAWGGVLPAVTLDYWYGIDANQFATRTPAPDHFSNLGSSAAATLQLPIWSWGANFSKVKQANLQKKQAVVELSAAQRTLLAKLRSFYNEGQAARAELELLSQSVQLASESLRLTTLRYQSGEATVLEVVDAQNTLTAASNAYDDGQVRFRVALANIQTLTGKF